MNDRTPIIPEVLPSEDDLPADLLAMERLARLLDQAVEIPGLRRKVGLDAATGLVPGLGDAVGAALSTWIIVGGLRHRVPARKIAKMILNVLVDMGLGALPVVGDLFDAFYHQNVGNMRILLDHRKKDRPPRSWKEIGAVATVVFLFLLSASLAVTIGVIVVIMKIAGWVAGSA